MELMNQSNNMTKYLGHLVDPEKKEWYHYDDKHNLWTCDCMNPRDTKVSICLSLCNHLLDEGEDRKLKGRIAKKRKDLELLESMSIEDIQKFKESIAKK